MGYNKPNPPLVDIEPHIRKYWSRELNDVQILQRLKEKNLFDRDKYGLAIKKFREYRTQLGLIRSRSSGYTIESIQHDMILLRQRYPHAGYGRIKKLFHQQGKEVKKRVIIDYMQRHEPDLVKQRIRRRLKRRRFWSAGVNDMWCIDQHDKLKKYGLALHTGVDPFTGKIKWLKVWHTNSNPRLIFRYYLECVKKDGYTCLVTQSDPGPENFCIAKGHSFIRQSLDPSLHGTLQHRYMKDKNNLPPEILWSNLRRNFSPGLEDLLSNSDVKYDRHNALEYNVFKWVVIPWYQAELDEYRDLINSTKKRSQVHKILPHGPPDDIEEHPEEYKALDFKVIIHPKADYIQEAEQLYAPPDHPVFELVPPEFDFWASEYYAQIGSPAISRHNVWSVYEDLLDKFQRNAPLFETFRLQSFQDDRDEFVEEVRQALGETAIGDTVDDLQPLHYDKESSYMGGVRGGLGVNEEAQLADGIVDFSSDEESEDSTDEDGNV